MKRRLLFMLVSVAALNASHAQSFEWAKSFGGGNNDSGYSLATDASGNVYTAGQFYGTVDFDPGPNEFNLTAAGGNEGYVSKIDADGNFIWAKRIGGTSNDNVNSIAVDASGNVYTAGQFYGTVDFDPGTETFNLTSFGERDIYVSKLDMDGNFVWAKKLGGSDYDVARSLAISNSGNVYVGGLYSLTADFDPGAEKFEMTSNGGTDIFIAKLGSDGNFIWAKSMGGNGADVTYAIAVDALDNVYNTGVFNGTADFDPGTGALNLSSNGGDDVFVSKLNANGDFQWAKKFGGTGNDYGKSIAVDATSNVYTTGYLFSSTTDMDPGAGTFSMINAGVSDIFISKLSTEGDFVWAKQLAGNDLDIGASITIGESGNVYSTGYFYGTVDFDPGTSAFDITSAGIGDVYISALDADGNFVWAKSLGGNDNDGGNSITTDASENVLLTGSFTGVVSVDTESDITTLTANAMRDVFVCKLSQATVSVEESNFETDITVYPNPFVGQVKILLNEKFTRANVVVSNAMGQEILNTNYLSNNQIDLMFDGDAGVYFIAITTENHKALLRVVKQ